METNAKAFNPQTNLQAMTQSPAKPLQKLRSIEGAGKQLGVQAKTFDKKIRTKLGPEQRRAKNSYAVAQKSDGSVIMSDGTITESPYKNKLEVLRRNVLAQQNFTPEAEEFLMGIPLDALVGGQNLGEEQHVRPGQHVSSLRIGISPRTFEKTGPVMTTEVMTHEFLHALDANANTNAHMQDELGEAREAFSIPATGMRTADSFGFRNEWQQGAPKSTQRTLPRFLSNYDEKPQTRDMEAFAQYAAPQGNKVLLQPAGQRYSNVFVPATKKPLNYTPVYPTAKTYEDILKDMKLSGGWGRSDY